ncbi:unnamed protein product [Prorocentrum cordatum]|uniref:Ankyrin repeat domain-containing protein n=1 Tax=Prorocentrum cordatum TaxID=2364126 RepID=A0ABN9UXQ7_9DINO|nr:unnamed protein product [Polarella glacialis]
MLGALVFIPLLPALPVGAMWAQRNAALLVAARRGDWEKVKGLLSEGAGLRLNQTGNGGMSLLMLAARAGAADVCASLLASRADPGSREAASGSTALVLAAGAPERKAAACRRFRRPGALSGLRGRAGRRRARGAAGAAGGVGGPGGGEQGPRGEGREASGRAQLSDADKRV